MSEKSRTDMLQEKIEFRRKQQVQFIVSQTNYCENEALKKLELHNNDVMKVVGEYLGILPKEDHNLKKTKNQKVYSVIRDIMDKGSNNYRMQQERAKRIEQIKELSQQQQKERDKERDTKEKEKEKEQEKDTTINHNENFILKEKLD